MENVLQKGYAEKVQQEQLPKDLDHIPLNDGEVKKDFTANCLNLQFNVTTNVKWLFNPPFAAHFEGAWERLIRLVKKVLLSVLKQQTQDDEMLQTALCEVETILNDRPITTASGDPNDLEPLTPNYLLQLNSKPLLPPGLFKKDDLYARRRWKQVQYLAIFFGKDGLQNTSL